MKESDIQRQIMLEVSKLGHRVFRNVVGLVTLSDGRKMRVGLCVGSADLIGWTKNGIFLAIEVKTLTGKIRPEQSQFISQVNIFGGIAFVAHSPQEAAEKLKCLPN